MRVKSCHARHSYFHAHAAKGSGHPEIMHTGKILSDRNDSSDALADVIAVVGALNKLTGQMALLIANFKHCLFHPTRIGIFPASKAWDGHLVAEGSGGRRNITSYYTSGA